MLTCPTCGLLNPPEAMACDCGYQFVESRPMSAPSTPQTSQPTESAKAVGVATGLTAGIGCGVIFFVTGLLLSLTGIGLIIGVPMMLVALLLPLLGPAFGLAQIKGPCPYCGTILYASSTAPGVTCRGCKEEW